MEKMTTVEQVLRQGGTVDDVMAIVREEIEKVNAKLHAEEAERQKQEAVAKAEHDALLDLRRKELTAATINYLMALGLMTEEDAKNITPEEVETAITEMESIFIAQAKFMEFLKQVETTPVKKETKENVEFNDLLKHIAQSL